MHQCLLSNLARFQATLLLNYSQVPNESEGILKSSDKGSKSSASSVPIAYVPIALYARPKAPFVTPLNHCLSRLCSGPQSPCSQIAGHLLLSWAVVEIGLYGSHSKIPSKEVFTLREHPMGAGPNLVSIASVQAQLWGEGYISLLIAEKSYNHITKCTQLWLKECLNFVLTLLGQT